MKIVQVAPQSVRVPPEKYGGAERVIYYLTEGLIQRGHEVTLFASGDSQTSAKLIAITPRSLFERKIPFDNRFFDLIEITKAIEFAMKNHYDLIHDHLYDIGLTLSRISHIPLVHTTHGNTDPNYLPEGRSDIVREYRDAFCVSISDYQQKISPLNYLATVYNGIDLHSFTLSGHGGHALAWLGRFDPKKGAAEAIVVAQRAKIRLILAGRLETWTPRNVAYYNQRIKPEFKQGEIDYIGEIGPVERNQLLGDARVLLNPISWEEPFGLVVIEANACGTPVVAFARGAMPELIKDGVNGFLVKPGDIDGMVEAVKKIYAMPEGEYQKMRQNCRKHVENNFTVEKMVDGYEKVYQKVIEEWKSRKRS